MLPSITIEELKQLKNPNIIDIRSIENYNNNHIPGAINIPFDKLLLQPNKYLKLGEYYYLYCQKGYSSATVARSLSSLGYMTRSIIGGYEEWLLKN